MAPDYSTITIPIAAVIMSAILGYVGLQCNESDNRLRQICIQEGNPPLECSSQGRSR